MKLKIQVVLFLLSLLIVGSLFGQNGKNFSSLNSVAGSDPKKIIEILSDDDLNELSEIEKNYLYSKSVESLGFYQKADSSINYALENLTFPKDSNLYFELIKILIDQKKITDDFASSLKLLYELLNFSERREDTLKMISIHTSLGELYRATENFKLGLQYLLKAEIVAINYPKTPKAALARIYNRRAAIFLQDRIYLDSVETLSKRVIEIAKQIGDKNLEAVSSNELGYLYLNQNKKEAEKYLKNAIIIWDNMGYAIYAANARLNLGRFYNNEKKYDAGIDLMLEILETVNNSDWKWERGSYYEVLANLYSGKKDYEKAFYYAALSRDFLLDVSEKQYNEKLAIISTELEVNKKEKELIEKQKEIDLAKIEKAQNQEERKYLFWFLTITLIIAMVFVLLTILVNNQRVKLRVQKSTIVNTNEKLKEVISQKETLLREVNHRVKNNLSVLTGLLYLQQKELKNEEAINILKDSQIRINTIALIHESLYQRDDMEKVDFQDYLDRLVGYIKSIYWNKEIEIDLELNCQDLKPELSNSIPLAMILNELLTNSFKYAFKEVSNPNIGIEFSKTENELIYFDNGPGLPKSLKKGSLGLKLIEIFSAQLNAKIESQKIEGYFVTSIKFC